MLLFPTRHTCPLPLAWRLYSTRQDPSPECHYELFLVHSLLLEETCSVCCPLLTYMLKFSRLLHLMPCIFHAMCLITSPWQPRAYQLASAMAHAPILHTIHDITDNVQRKLHCTKRCMVSSHGPDVHASILACNAAIQQPTDSRNVAGHQEYCNLLHPSSMLGPMHP